MNYKTSYPACWCFRRTAVYAAFTLGFMSTFAVAADAVWINAGFNDFGQNQIVNFSEIIRVEMSKDSSGTKDLAKMWRSKASGTIDTTDTAAIAAIKAAISKVSGEWLQIEPKAGYAQMRFNALQKILFAYTPGPCTATLLTPSGAQGAIKDTTDCKALKSTIASQPSRWYLLQSVTGAVDAYLNLDTVQDAKFKGPPNQCSVTIDISTGNSASVNDAALVKTLQALLKSDCK